MASFDGEEQFSPHELLQAYHQAAQQGDREAMDQLHGALLRAYTREAPKATDDMSGPARFLAGVGHGMQRLGEGAANIVGIHAKGHGFDTTDEGLKSEDQTARDLLSTRGGYWGDIAGQTAATAPLGMGTGAALRAGGAALGRTALNPTVLKMALNAGKAATSAGEGALQAGAMADPDEQGSEAAKGAVLSAALSKLGQAGGRYVRGIVEKSKPAQDLIDAAASTGRKLFLPISQAAKDSGISGAAKAVYQHVLPFALGVEGRLAGQSERAASTVRNVRADMANQHITEEGLGRFRAGDTVEGKTAEQTGENLSAAQEAGYKKNFDQHAFEVPMTFRDQVASDLKRLHPDLSDVQRETLATEADKIMQERVTETNPGQMGISGRQLRAAIDVGGDRLSALTKKMGFGESDAKDIADTGMQSFRDIVASAKDDAEGVLRNSDNLKELDTARDFIANMNNYYRLAAKDPQVAAVVRATRGAAPVRGAYEFKDAARDMIPGTDDAKLLQNAHEVLGGESPGNVTPAGRHLFHSAGQAASVLAPVAGVASGHGEAGALMPAAFIGGSHTLASQPAQEMLYGDRMHQQFLADFLRKYPGLASSLGGGARSAMVAGHEAGPETEDEEVTQ